MSKPWKSEPRGAQLEAFVGAYRIPTGRISSTADLLWCAGALFGIDTPAAVDTAVETIEALGKKERSARAHKNREIVLEIVGEVSSDLPKAAGSSSITQQGLSRMMETSKPQMIDGDPFECTGELDIDPAQLLRKVVSAVISAGRADILWEFPDVLAFFGSRIPRREEVAHLHNIDERMFEAADKWPNRKQPS
jgi:hypothetical protein